MGRVQDQSNNQAEYELHPQEYQYDPTQDPTLPLEDDQYQEESSYPQDPSDAAAGIEPQPQQQFQQPLHYGSQQAQPAAAAGIEPQSQQQFQQPPQYGSQQAQPTVAAGIEPQYQQQFQQPPQYGAQQEQPAAAYISQRNQQVSRPQTPQMNAMKANQLAPTVPYQMQRPRPLPLHMQQSPQIRQCSSQPPGPGLGTGTNGYPAPFPAAYRYEPPAGAVNAEYWTSGLFDCMNDPTNALITAFFPCVTFGQLAEIVDHGHTTCGTSGLLYGMMTLFVVPCILSCTYRTKLRNAFSLYESPAPDWVVHCLCECCALCQEYRELQARGLDPSIGWMGNQMKGENIQMQQGAMVPPRGQTMMV